MMRAESPLATERVMPADPAQAEAFSTPVTPTSAQLATDHGAGQAVLAAPLANAGAAATPDSGGHRGCDAHSGIAAATVGGRGLPRSGTPVCDAPSPIPDQHDDDDAGRTVVAARSTTAGAAGPGRSTSDALRSPAGPGVSPTDHIGRTAAAVGAGRTGKGAIRCMTGPHGIPIRDDVAGPHGNADRVLVADPSSSWITSLGPGRHDDVAPLTGAGSDARRGGDGAGRSECDARTLFAGPVPRADQASDAGAEPVEDGVGAGHSGGSAARIATAGPDLAILHASLGHYARQLADLQKLRIAQGNRVAAMEREGIPEPFVAFGREALEALAAQERALNAYLARQARRHPMAPWIAEQRGIGLPGFVRLLGITGPLDRFATVSKLWKYLGLHTVDGQAPRRERGQKLSYSPQGRVLCHQIGESIVKMGKGGEYRRVYDDKKVEYLARERTGESGCPTGAVHKTKTGAIVACVKASDDGKETSAHVHAMARRYAVKRLVRRAWGEWRRLAREDAL